MLIWKAQEFISKSKEGIPYSTIIYDGSLEGTRLKYIEYDGNEYYFVEDTIRCNLKMEKYKQFSYPHLKVFEDNNKKYLFLVIDPEITFDEMKKSLGSSYDSNTWKLILTYEK